MRLSLLAVPLISIFVPMIVGCKSPSKASASVDIRDDLIEAVRRGDPDFPNGREVLLTHFSYVGRVNSVQGQIFVIDMRSVLSGMLSPRGLNYVVFVSDQLRFLGKVSYIDSRPLWCDGSKVILFGGITANQGSGNVIDLAQGYAELRVIREKIYGSD